jgi:hypothetical protein
MKFINLSRMLVAGAVSTLLFTSCEKAPNPEPIGDAGQTVVKFLQVSKKTNNIELINTPQVLNMVDVRRDVPNAAALNRTMKVTIEDNPGAVTDFNAANNTAFETIPSGLYTIDPENPKVGNKYTVTLNPGEFAKWLRFTIPNALALDLSKTYAFGFTISAVDADGKIAVDAKTIVVEVGVKNQWDGRYRLNGFFNHPSYTGFYSTDKIELRTAGANVLDMFCTIWDEYSHPFLFNGGLNRFADVAPRYIVNSNNTISLSNGGPGNTLNFVPAVGANNRYDPTSKTFYIAHGYQNAAGAYRIWTDTLIYLGPR